MAPEFLWLDTMAGKLKMIDSISQVESVLTYLRF